MDEPMSPYSRFVVDGFDADALLGVVRDTRFEQRLCVGAFQACVQRLVFPEFSLDSGAYTLPIFASGSFSRGMIALAPLSLVPSRCGPTGDGSRPDR